MTFLVSYHQGFRSSLFPQGPSTFLSVPSHEGAFHPFSGQSDQVWMVVVVVLVLAPHPHGLVVVIGEGQLLRGLRGDRWG